MTVLEICVDSVESATAAESGGAQRVELCSALSEGGLTPSLGLIHVVRSRIKIGIHVMIRPRSGDFFYSQDDFAVMRDDIAMAAGNGVDGVVLGLLTADGNIDVERTCALVELAQPMEVTFHRAIDMAPSLTTALEDIIRTGATRVLTSGGESSAMLGRQRIGELVRLANGRIGIMAGGGVRAANVAGIAHATGAREFHASLRKSAPSPIPHQKRKVHLAASVVDEYARSVVQPEDVRILRRAVESASELAEVESGEVR
jgi:copper homeostasis protein